MATSTASATSMNFVGFEEMRGHGTPDMLHNRIYIMPTQVDAGFLPGQQPSQGAEDLLEQTPPTLKQLNLQGYKRFYGGYW